MLVQSQLPISKFSPLAFGVNQQQANSRSLTKSIDTGGSVNFVISETPKLSNQTPGDGWNKYTKYNNRVAPPRICFGTVACKSSFTNFASICKCWVTRNNKSGCHIYVKDRKPGNKAAFHIKSKQRISLRLKVEFRTLEWLIQILSGNKYLCILILTLVNLDYKCNLPSCFGIWY